MPALRNVAGGPEQDGRPAPRRTQPGPEIVLGSLGRRNTALGALPLRQLAVHYHASADGLAAAAEVFDVLETQPEAAGGRPPRLTDHAPSAPSPTPR
jgi:hypothetical protein